MWSFTKDNSYTIQTDTYMHSYLHTKKHACIDRYTQGYACTYMHT